MKSRRRRIAVKAEDLGEIRESLQRVLEEMSQTVQAVEVVLRGRP